MGRRFAKQGAQSPPPEVNIFTVNHLYNSVGNFQIVITATDDDNGSFSNSLSVTVSPRPAPPNAPTNLAATAVSPNQINLQWTDNSNNENGFVIERCDGNGKCTTFFHLAQTGANVNVFSDMGLSPGMQYTYQVLAFNAVGASAFSNTAKDRTPRR